MGALKITGQSAEPTVTASDAGMVYYDTTANTLKVYNGTEWTLLNELATGGIVYIYTVDGVRYRSHTFLSSGVFLAFSGFPVDALIVGGGGGGSSGTAGGAGGGAGGMRVLVSQALTQGTYTITVGDKGVSGDPSSGNSSTPIAAYKGTDGSDSSIVQTSGGSFSSTATGGGAGGLWGTVAAGLRNGNDGGSGGGGAETYLDNTVATVGGTGDGDIGTDGNAAGYYGGDGGISAASPSNTQFGAGAGGSASGNGTDAIAASKGGRAVAGLENDFRDGNAAGTVVGTNRFCGGGDGNGDSDNDVTGNTSRLYGGGDAAGASAVHVDQNAIANSGGGGAGGGTLGAGDGGSGIVVIRYAI